MKLSDLNPGDVVFLDAGFTCMEMGPHIVEINERGLYLTCDEGNHYLDGQEDYVSGELVGISFPSERT